MKWVRLPLVMLVLVSALSACTSRHITYAPVVDATMIERIPSSGAYRVLPGDTLYSIAWRYGLDYRYLASRNHIAPPYQIKVHEIIYLRGAPAKNGVIRAAQPAAPTVVIAEPNLPVKTWNWPARGTVISGFSENNKGINIAGRLGSPVYATAAGQVVYCGDGLRGYGNLIIIKHNNYFLSAYAHNRAVRVKQGDRVTAKQKIAEMGSSGTSRVMLHFEIRRNGKPVNPLAYIRS